VEVARDMVEEMSGKKKPKKADFQTERIMRFPRPFFSFGNQRILRDSLILRFLKSEILQRFPISEIEESYPVF
jgi:hypothetical protein